jgi:hypothetical protein
MHRGSCLCRAIQYEIESDLKAVVNCHCRFCRKAHGGVYTPLLFTPFSRFTLLEGADLVGRYHIARLEADRCFCVRCGTRLYNHAPSRGMISIVVNTLETDEILRPIAHINTESKCAWLEINDGLPQFLAVPGPAEFKELLSR